MPGRYFCGELSVPHIGTSRNPWRRQLNFRRLKKGKGKREELGNGRFISLKEAGFFSKNSISSGKTRNPILNLLQVTIFDVLSDMDCFERV